MTAVVPNLQNYEVRSSSFELVLLQALLEQISRLSSRRKQVRPERNLCLACTLNDRLQVERELHDELDYARQLRVRNRLLAGRLLLQDLVQQQLERVREIREVVAAASNLPRMVAEVAPDQLPEYLVQVHLALKQKLELVQIKTSGSYSSFENTEGQREWRVRVGRI